MTRWFKTSNTTVRRVAQSLRRHAHTLLMVALLAPYAPQLLAQAAPGGGGPPTMPLPTEAGTDTNNVLAALWGYGRFVVQVLLILVAAAIFIGVTTVCVRKFMEISERDGKLTEVIPVAGVGLLVLSVSALLLTIGWSVISTTTITL